jgi:hypothetical protein
MDELSPARVNHFVLKKQHLVDYPETKDIVQIAKDIGGLHGTSATGPYLSLYARSPSFRKKELAVALAQKKSLARIRYVRNTVYVLPKDFIPVAFAATSRIAEVTAERFSKNLGITPAIYARMASKILKVLEGRGLTAKEIKQKLQTASSVSPIVNLMCDKGLLVRSLPREGWKSNQHSYFLFDDYYPELDLSVYSEREAREIIIRGYVLSFGPVCEQDIAWWTGFPKAQVKEILDAMGDEVSPVEIPDWNDVYIVHSSERKSLLSFRVPELPVVNVLPSLDPYMMGYKKRQRYLLPEHEKMVFDRSGNATSVILVDGKVAGIWDCEEGLAKVFSMADLGKGVRKLIRTKVSDTGKFITEKPVRVEACRTMVPLTKRTAGSFMSPLKDCLHP